MTSKAGKNESKKSNESVAKKGKDDSAHKDNKSQSASSEALSEEGDTEEELDNLLTLLEEDLTDMDLEEAVEMIDEWHGILNKSKDAELKEIGNSLKHLKKLLDGSKIKEADLAEVMTALGGQVDKFANNAERGYKTKLHRLGKALSGEGKELASSDSAE
jgi:hypothetical protein